MEIASWYGVTPLFESALGTQVRYEGIVKKEPDIRANVQHLYVSVRDELLLVTADRYTEISYGDQVSLKGKLELPAPFETDLGRTFNYPGYLEARGVRYVVSFAQVQVQKQHQGNWFLEKLFYFKHVFMMRIEAIIPHPHVGLGEGLLLGVQQALGTNFETAFRATGIMHIVVLSGYNIMLVVTFVMYLLALFLPNRLQLFFGAFAIVLFALMVGLGATVVRASAMALLLLFSKATGRTYAVMRALMLTGCAMLILNPYLLVFDVGFQLSFIATVGLILIAPLLEKYFHFMPTQLGLREFLTATVSVQIFVTPILLYQMGQFSVVAIIVNLLVLPMVPIAMFLTFVTGIIGFISTTLALPFGYLAYLSLAYILSLAELFSKLPFASFTIPAFPFYIVALVYVFYAWVLWRMYTRTPGRAKSQRLTTWTIVDEEIFITNVKALQTVATTPVFFR